MDKVRIAKELVRIARSLTAAVLSSTFEFDQQSNAWILKSTVAVHNRGAMDVIQQIRDCTMELAETWMAIYRMIGHEIPVDPPITVENNELGLLTVFRPMLWFGKSREELEIRLKADGIDVAQLKHLLEQRGFSFKG